MSSDPFYRIWQKVGTFKTLQEQVENLPNFPFVVDVELTNKCNFQCKMCPTGLGIVNRRKRKMHNLIYTHIIREVGYRERVGIRFVRWGEPLLHPRVAEYIALAKSRYIRTHLNTNGSLLTEGKCRLLIDSGLDSIKFSFQGGNAMSYALWRTGGDFWDTIDKVKMMYRMRKSKNRPYIIVGTTIAEDENADEFVDIIKPYCDKVIVGKTQDLVNDVRQTPITYCPEMFKISVNCNGDVTFCCADYDGEMVLGNILKNTIYDLYHGDKAQNIRRKLLEGKLKELNVCRHCL